VPIVVQKFGGTSVADADRIREVAKHVAWTRSQGDTPVVVVSAMGKTTDDLIRLAEEVSEVQPGRELDMLLTAGERISMSLLCMALADLGVEAASFTGSQAGIITDSSHTNAKIVEVRADRVRDALQRGMVPVVAGFQGVSVERDVTTLGRGGSDTTAVALAAALGAERCEIYTDVSGVFTADPRLVPTARRLPRVSFEEMLEITATGARVLSHRSVEFARNHHVAVHVRSSFTWEPGTWITEEDPTMEQPIVSAVTSDVTEARITVSGIPDRPGIAAALFRALANASVNVDMIVQSTSIGGLSDISLTVPRTELDVAREVAQSLVVELGGSEVSVDDKIAQVSVVGAGMKTHPGVTAAMFEALASNEINIEMIATSPIRISCTVREDVVTDAVRALHETFGLSEAQAS
jgi:aspartate kinase